MNWRCIGTYVPKYMDVCQPRDGPGGHENHFVAAATGASDRARFSRDDD
jgi:hypothetical protein